MEKIDFINYQQPALNATNLNKLQDNTEDAIQEVQDIADDLDTNKLDKTSVKNTYSTSTTDTYSCNYVNGLETYSTNETRVGTWIDGKPIYRKVIHSGGISLSTTNTEISTGISNVDTVININFMYKFSTNMWYKLWNIKEIGYNKTNNKLLVSTTSSANFTDSNIVIEYTKTTD